MERSWLPVQSTVCSISSGERNNSMSTSSPALIPSTVPGMRRNPSARTMVLMTPAPRASGTAMSLSSTLPNVTRTNSSRPNREGIFRGATARTAGGGAKPAS